VNKMGEMINSYLFICRDNPFHIYYITVYGVESYEIAKKKATKEINRQWWAPEVKVRQIAELDSEDNTEKESKILNGVVSIS